MYTADCSNSLSTDVSKFTFAIKAKAQSPIYRGGIIHITDQEWTVTVPAATAALLKAIVPGDLVAQSSATLAATNTKEGTVTPATQQISTPLPDSGDLVTVAHPPDVAFTSTGGDSIVTFSGATQLINIPGDGGDIPVTVTCVPTGTITPLFTINVRDIPGSSPPPPPTTIKAVTLPVPVSNNGQIPGTGGNGSDFWVELFFGLLVIQIGIMLWSAGQGRRRRRTIA